MRKGVESTEGAGPEPDPGPTRDARLLYLGQRQVLQPLPVLAEDVPREGPPRCKPRLSRDVASQLPFGRGRGPGLAGAPSSQAAVGRWAAPLLRGGQRTNSPLQRPPPPGSEMAWPVLPRSRHVGRSHMPALSSGCGMD